MARLHLTGTLARVVALAVGLSVCLAAVLPASAGAAGPGPSLSLFEPGFGSPASLQEAYDLTALSATGGYGKTIAIVELGGDAEAESDLATYRGHYGLAPCTSANGCFREVNKDGGTALAPDNAENVTETSLDVDAVSALCPNCHILLVDSEHAPSVGQATAARLGAQIISDSFAAQREGTIYETFNFPGVATVGSSGDNGYLEHSRETFAAPSALPNTTAAGGTVLKSAVKSGEPSIRGFTETAWSGSGSTCDPYVVKPPWQTDGGCPGRAVADLSADAGAPIGIYSKVEGGYLESGGTSLSAPLVAAFYAITNAPAENPSWAYGSAAGFNDVTLGSNALKATCPAGATYLCNAGPGYDGPTGVGSISGSAVRGAPGIAHASMVNGSYTQSAFYNSGTKTTSAALQGGVYTNGLPTTYWWQYGREVFESQTVHLSLPASCAISSVSGNLSALQPTGTYRYRLVAQNALGTTYGYTVSVATEPGHLPNPEPFLPSSGAPTSCPTPRLFPDSPNPVRPAQFVPIPKLLPPAPPVLHHGQITKLQVRHGLVSFRDSCPPQATGKCLVRTVLRFVHAKQVLVKRLEPNSTAQVRVHIAPKLRAARSLHLEILVREPPGSLYIARQKVVPIPAEKHE